MRHQESRCAIQKNVGPLDKRKWHCCECGWPNKSCVEMHAALRVGETSASGPRCGDDATPYLKALSRQEH